jgi:hypothetical protein
VEPGIRCQASGALLTFWPRHRPPPTFDPALVGGAVQGRVPRRLDLVYVLPRRGQIHDGCGE